MKIAQAEYLTGLHGRPPVLLIDDVMGELDARRRAGLLPLLHQARRTGGQVFMTCTEANWPAELGSELTRWEVAAGTLEKVQNSKLKVQPGPPDVPGPGVSGFEL